MLVNNPMGSRRRRRFYHRAGVVPIPGDRFKGDFNDPNFFKYDPEPLHSDESNDRSEEGDQPFSLIFQGGKRRVSFISIASLHTRLLDIVDSLIALAETEDKQNAKQEKENKTNDVIKQGGNTNQDDSQLNKDPDHGIAQATRQGNIHKTAHNTTEDGDNRVKESGDSKAKIG